SPKSSWPGFETNGQLSQASPNESLSEFSWFVFGVLGQLSMQSGTLSRSASGASAQFSVNGRPNNDPTACETRILYVVPEVTANDSVGPLVVQPAGKSVAHCAAIWLLTASVGQAEWIDSTVFCGLHVR